MSLTMGHPGRRRRIAAVTAVAMAGLLAACSSSSSPTTTTAGHHRTAPLGSTVAVWEAANPATTSDGVSGYGPLVHVGKRTIPQFTDVQQQAGRVVGWRMTLPAGTSPASALTTIRDEIPTDARQTASWRAPGGTIRKFCEVLNYQSAQLANDLGQPPPSPPISNIGVEFHERVHIRRGVSKPAHVQQARVSTTPATPGQRCSSG